METTLLLIRHGYIDLADRIPGRMPGIHLSKTGREQAIECAKRISHYNVTQIYSSPLDRAIETAIPIAQHFNLEINRNEGLTEIDFGHWTNKTFSELEEDSQWKRFHMFRCGTGVPGGESMIEVQFRMIQEILKIHQNNSGKTIAIISHHDPIKSVIAYFLGISLDLFLRISIPNASLSILSMFDDSVVIRCIGITSMIDPESTTKI